MQHLPYISAHEADKAIRSGDHIHLSSIASVPQILIEALCERAGELTDVHFHHFHTEGPAPYGSPEHRNAFWDQGFFVGPNLRPSVQDIAYTNDPRVIALNPGMVSINSAIEIDLTGQVCTDSIGTRPTPDFHRPSRRPGGLGACRLPAVPPINPMIVL